jgi:hypothetical protein
MMFTMFKLLKALLAVFIMAPMLVQGREKTWVRLFHDVACQDLYMDIEVWADTCADWIELGWGSHMVLRRNFLRKQYIHTFGDRACARGVMTCIDNQYAPRCVNQRSFSDYPEADNISHAINSWGVPMDTWKGCL